MAFSTVAVTGSARNSVGHAAGGGFFAVLEKFNNFLAGLRFHLDENLFGVILGEIGEKVGGGVGIHFLDNVGSTLGIERFHNRFLNLGVDFFESFGRDIFVEGAEDGFPLVGSEIFDNVSDVGGMKLGQSGMRNFEFDAARRVSFDEIDKLHGMVRSGIFCNRIWRAVRGASPRSKRPYCATGADIDRGNPQSVMQLARFGDGIDLQFDVIDADDLAAIDVDYLLIEKIAFQEE